MRQPERHVHISILTYLRRVLPGAIVCHVPNGGRRDAATGALMKRLGVVAGMPDLMILLPSGRTVFAEIKADGGSLSKSQLDVRLRLQGLGYNVAVLRSIDDARLMLAALKIPNREVVA